ncbi:peptide chain release factor N(5)-glutamine methyltransferase [Sedimentisphaera salicampi]|uniref:Release factor glutamine methyltransferase n=1 Tax=Sedimentisphaera salicampi TaxID=1941349 RepID=A0A1W6LQ41_9BACT|nr:peptide chain release factor N(5)-glutamine methyltransferase [Sedimentisphaera salicampi]ARN57852.1 Release factor glutamine methyltransferase [Sedimentisphaera salicampi]
MTEWTTTKLLDWVTDYLGKAGADNPRLKSEMLISEVLGRERIELYITRPVAQDKLSELRAKIRKAAEGMPVEYIIGKTTFYSLEITLNGKCLIPRPETEDLTERGIEFLRQRGEGARFLDLGCGSGCITAAILKNCDKCSGVCADKSDGALSCAGDNLQRLKLAERAKIKQSDMFAGLEEGEKYDLIISNPPYVSESEYQQLSRSIRDFEPSEALLAGEEGLDYYRIISEEAEKFILPDSLILLEIGGTQGEKIKPIFEQKGYNISIENDFAGNPRIARIYKQ